MNLSLLIKFLDQHNIEYQENGKTNRIVSFRIGGKAKIIVFPETTEHLVKILNFIKEEKHIVLGNGTNCFFSDSFYDGIVIVTSKISKVLCENNFIVAQTGACCGEICALALEKSLTGLEFAFGIPGTVGGCVTMNASAYEHSFSQIVSECEAFDYETGKIIKLSNKECCFFKKKSVFSSKKLCLLSASLKLEIGDKKSILEKMQNYLNRRKKSQPLDKPSAGSTFIRPKTGYASQLIDKCGLKGYSIGGAQVSKKHAGFIINTGGATSKDVIDLIEFVKNRVYDTFGVMLKEEIIYIE